MKIKFLLFCSLLSYQTAFSDNIATVHGSPYLFAPTGQYAVGYQDFYWLNHHVCPDPYFNGDNQVDFSSHNQMQFCREIMARIYYPATVQRQQASFEYPPMVKLWQDQMTAAQIPGMTAAQISALSLIETYAQPRLPLVPNQTFPVIIFNPGIDDDAQDYEDVIAEIVSYGYMVVAINNSFVSSAVEFPDHHVVNYVASANANTLEQAALSDIVYVYQQLHDSHQNQTLFAAMDLQHLGLFGHSLGAVVTVILAHQHPAWFQAAAALAAPAYHGNYAAYRGFTIPFIHIHDANWDSVYKRQLGKDTFHLTDHEYFVWLTPDLADVNYSHHNNFSDASTLQYQATFAAFNRYFATFDNPYPLDVGSMDGYQAVEITTRYLIQFFDMYLKHQPSNIFTSCVPLQNTLLTCGPGNLT